MESTALTPSSGSQNIDDREPKNVFSALKERIFRSMMKVFRLGASAASEQRASGDIFTRLRTGALVVRDQGLVLHVGVVVGLYSDLKSANIILPEKYIQENFPGGLGEILILEKVGESGSQSIRICTLPTFGSQFKHIFISNDGLEGPKAMEAVQTWLREIPKHHGYNTFSDNCQGFARNMRAMFPGLRSCYDDVVTQRQRTLFFPIPSESSLYVFQYDRSLRAMEAT